MGVTAEQARRLRMERWTRRRNRKAVRELRKVVAALRRMERAGRDAARAFEVFAAAARGVKL